MGTARTLGVLIPALLLWGGGVVACKDEHADCTAIAPGTPLASLPVLGPASIGYCSRVSGPMDEVQRLSCCSRPPTGLPSDSGVRDCGQYGLVDCTKLAPFEVWAVGQPYGDWVCPPEPDGTWGNSSYECRVWVRDGSVVGACGGCTPD